MTPGYSVPCAVAVPIASVAIDAIATVAVRILIFYSHAGHDGKREQGNDSPYMTISPLDVLIDARSWLDKGLWNGPSMAARIK